MLPALPRSILPFRLGLLPWVAAFFLSACGGGGGQGPESSSASSQACSTESSLDGRLRCLLELNRVTRLEVPPVVADSLFNAGQALFNSTLLSGSGEVACSSCHATNNAGIESRINIGGVPTTRALHLNLRGGTATTSITNTANVSALHRNTPDLVNRLQGNPQFMFWDGRVARRADGGFSTPAGSALPAGLDSLLAAQALFPLLSRDEMLGYKAGTNGGVSENALASLADDPVEGNPLPVWNGIMGKVKADATLSGLLKLAYPDVPVASLDIRHVANAIAAFQLRRWNPVRATANFHGYLAGSADMIDAAKRGGILFFDKAGCHRCHNGPKLTDSRFHNLAVPQIGPGFGSGARETPLVDKGRYEVTGSPSELYAFLTPSLWEAKMTAPYLHNGVYATLEQVILHHLDSAGRARAFRCADAPVLQAGVAVSCRDSTTAPALYADMVARLAPEMRTPITLDSSELADLVTFITQLTDGAN